MQFLHALALRLSILYTKNSRYAPNIDDGGHSVLVVKVLSVGRGL